MFRIWPMAPMVLMVLMVLAALVASSVLSPAARAADLVIGLGADVTTIDPHALNARTGERTYAHEVKPQ